MKCLIPMCHTNTQVLPIISLNHRITLQVIRTLSIETRSTSYNTKIGRKRNNYMNNCSNVVKHFPSKRQCGKPSRKLNGERKWRARVLARSPLPVSHRLFSRSVQLAAEIFANYIPILLPRGSYLSELTTHFPCGSVFVQLTWNNIAKSNWADNNFSPRPDT